MICKDLSKLGYTSSSKDLGVLRAPFAEGRGELTIPGGGGGGGEGGGGGGAAGLEDIQEEREEVVTAGLENLSIS